MKLSKLTIIVDTREQLPYLFKDYPCNVIRKGLKSGDYSLQGYENEVAIERKSKSDLYGSLGKGRVNFEEEFQRLQNYKYAALIVESNLAGLLKQPGYSRMEPKAVLNSLISWSIRYGVQIYFGENRTYSECLVYRILEKFVTFQVNEVKSLLKAS